MFLNPLYGDACPYDSDHYHSGENADHQYSGAFKPQSGAGQLRTILGVLLVLALCVQIGHSVNQYLSTKGFLLPGFLTAMLVGILLTNAADAFKVSLHPVTVSKFGEVALNISLSISLMSMEFSALAHSITPVTVALLIQTLVMTLFAVFVVFRVMGTRITNPKN